MKINMQNVSLAFCAGIPEQFPATNIPQIAISGRSNVGKSSLINTLLGRKSLARESNRPGKTITVNFYSVDEKLYLVDLPGYGYARRNPSERERLSLLGDGYFKLCHPKLVIQLIDMKVGPTENDYIMLDWLNQSDIPYVIAATKSDKLNKSERTRALNNISSEKADVIPFSSLNGEGKNEIWKIILHCIGNNSI